MSINKAEFLAIQVVQRELTECTNRLNAAQQNFNDIIASIGLDPGGNYQIVPNKDGTYEATSTELPAPIDVTPIEVDPTPIILTRGPANGG